MFISGGKDTRGNGLILPSSSGKNNGAKEKKHCVQPNNVYIKKELNYCDSAFITTSEYSYLNVKKEDIEIKSEPLDEDYKNSAHSIIGLRDDKSQITAFNRSEEFRISHHESLQRIESEEVFNYYQQNWFSPSLERLNLEDRSRDERIEITRHEFQRHLFQITRSNLGRSNKLPDVGSRSLKQRRRLNKPSQPGYDSIAVPKMCECENCHLPALPCAKHCMIHIMHNTDQVLFDYCTAKFADNTQCSVPVFDITHELPLCREHTRKRDHYKMHHEAKPKKIRKKVKPSAMIRPQKRNKKKKKALKPVPSGLSSSRPVNGLNIKEVELQQIIESESPELVEDMEIVDQVLDLNEAGLEQELSVPASHILEETDISNVLSTIHVDEFSDFFSVNRNGEYEPSREEAEELEKALAEVDNDVKSLEKLSQTHGILENFLDEHALAEQLVQLPDVFHNGYASCGDNMVSQTSSYLLPIEPRTNS